MILQATRPMDDAHFLICLDYEIAPAASAFPRFTYGFTYAGGISLNRRRARQALGPNDRVDLTVGLANKTARIARAVRTRNEVYAASAA